MTHAKESQSTVALEKRAYGNWYVHVVNIVHLANFLPRHHCYTITIPLSRYMPDSYWKVTPSLPMQIYLSTQSHISLICALYYLIPS